jgi:RimJ/RimL family protein N-acetyltransferase
MPRCANEQDTGQGLGWTPPSPFTIRLETPRLVLRPYELTDAPALHQAVAASRDHLLPWMPWARDGHTDADASAHYITTQIMALRNPTAFTAVGIGIFDRHSARLLGGTGVHGVHRDTACAETGYWIRADAAGRGYATEATGAVLSWAFRPQPADGLALRRIVIYCSSQNHASRRIPEKLGLRLELQQRQDYFLPGLGCTDRLGWGVLADEWDCAANRLAAGVPSA